MTFADFVQQQQLGQVRPVQCEVTYINHLEIGEGWCSAADVSRIFPSWSGKMNGEFLPPPESVGFDVTFRMPDEKGRLRVSLKPAIRTEDGVELLQLILTARSHRSRPVKHSAKLLRSISPMQVRRCGQVPAEELT